MAEPDAVTQGQAEFEAALAVVRRLLAGDHPHLIDIPSTERLVTEAGLKLPELDEIYFSALQELGRRPPLDDSEVHTPINLNDPNLEELARHIAFNCPVMSPAEQAEVLRPDPSVTTQADAGILRAADETAGPPRNRGLLGFAVLMAVIAVIAAVMLAMME